MRPNSLCARFLFLSVCAAGMAGAGTLFEYEGFSYPSGSSLSSANGGSGWSGGWGSPGGLDATVTATSLTFQNLAVSGGAVSSAGFQPPAMGSSVAYWGRDLGTSIGADNTTAYMSFLLRPDAGYGYYGGLNIGNALFAGVSGNQSFFGLEGPLGDLNLSNVPVVAGTPVWFVIRFDFLPGNDRVSLYLNPTPGQPEPAVPTVVKTDLDVGTVTSLTINNYGGFTVDEIRIGSSYDVVTPVEAPSVPAVSIFALTILGASLALLAAWALALNPHTISMQSP